MALTFDFGPEAASGAASGDTLRLGGETHTVAGLESATVRLADGTGR